MNPKLKTALEWTIGMKLETLVTATSFYWYALKEWWRSLFYDDNLPGGMA